MPTAPRVDIRDLRQHIGETVAIHGWLYHRRSKGKIHFLQLRDGSGHVQAIMGKKDVPEAVFELAGNCAREAAITVTGAVQADERAPSGVELHATDLTLVAPPLQEYPIAIQEDVPNVDKLLAIRHLWIRSKIPHAVLRVRHEVVQAIRDFYYDRGFVNVDTPMFTPSACEGTTTLFEVPYFDLGMAYLTQSGQLYNEANAAAFGKVYSFGPVFRAERSKTRRHLTEFWMVEPEVAYADLDDVMDLAEAFLVSITARVLDRCQEELKLLERDQAKLEAVAAPLPRVAYHDACRQIIAKKAELAAADDEELQRLATATMDEPGGDFGAPDETVLGMLYDRPVMVHRYPADIKAFYMARDPEDPSLALCVDVIAPEGAGEIIGGGERETDYEKLLDAIDAHGLPRADMEWYLDIRRYGSVPHGGFGLGVERTVAWFCGIPHIREAIPYPRMLYRIYP